VCGTGYAQARALIQGESGIRGGIFAHSLVVGASFGGERGGPAAGSVGTSIAVIGMVAYFSGVVQPPIMP
jgi:H+/Cl- antiporter ClcA